MYDATQVFCAHVLLVRSMASGRSSLNLSSETLDNLSTPNPATFNCPPQSSKIFLAPYQDFKY